VNANIAAASSPGGNAQRQAAPRSATKYRGTRVTSDATTETRRPDAGAARTPVMADVARLAGVSHQTVSRVLHDSPNVRAQTRERVLAAMRSLEYRPNSVARALVTGRTRTVGVVSFDTTLYGPASTLLAIEQAAHDAGYFVSIVSLRVVDRESVLNGLRRLREHGADGAVVIAPQESAVDALRNLPAGLPVVVAEAGPDDALPVVAVDQFAGGRAATRHLLALGHRTVWHVAGPSDWLEAKERMAGWRAELDDAGADAPAPLRGDWSPASGYALGRRLVAADVTAVFVGNDQMALGLLRAFHEAGRDVPRDCSVLGFDDIPESAYFTPPLTTVRQDFGEVGRRSVHTLLGAIQGAGQDPRREIVAPQLVVRASTAPPPAA
jgi:DNA-binding LacI/PurR family transcriptional regulator